MAVLPFNSDNISELIAEGGNLDVHDLNGDSPLHYAVKTGSESLVDLLLQHGVNIDSRNAGNNTPLHEAASNDKLPIVKKLLLAGSNVSLRNLFGQTPLHYAIYQRFDSITETILEATADEDFNDCDWLSCLHSAVERRNSLSVISKLLDKVTNIYPRNHTDKNPIFPAVYHQSNELLIIMLLDKGFRANIKDSRGITPLHLVMKRTKRDTVELLLDSGVEIDVKDPDGWTPLFHAVECNNIPVVDLLLSRGADVNIQDTEGKSPLHISPIRRRYSTDNHLELVERLLLEDAIIIDQKDKYGQTALLLAVRDNNTPVIDLLLLKESNINVQDSKGNSPILIASKNNHLASLKRLLCEKDYDINKKNFDGNTALHLAVENNHIDIVNLLLKNGASLNVQNGLGRTPLHVAVHYENSNCVKCLLGAGARVDITDNMGKTPLDLSAKIPDPIRRKNSITNYLKKHIIKIRSANLEIGSTMQNYDFTGYEPFTESCLVEVEKIKTKKFGGTSLFRLFSYTNNENPMFAGNSEMENFINSGHLKSEFPIYSTLLKLKFIEIKERNSLLSSIVFDIRVKEGDFLRDVHLPNELKRTILCYLPNKDLENLRKACQ